MLFSEDYLKFKLYLQPGALLLRERPGQRPHLGS